MNSIMETVCNVCNAVRSNSKHGTSFPRLLTLLRREFKKRNFDIKIKSLRHKRLLNDEFYVNAYYDPTDDANTETPIEIIIHHNFTEGVGWDRRHITDFLIQIFDATVHELKHQRQSLKRNHETYWSNSNISCHEDYLADPDEIDAYSVSIAIELCRSLGKYRALKYMGRFNSLSRLKFRDTLVSPNLFVYVQTFGNIENPIIKHLAKKVYVRLQKVDTDVIFV